MLVRITTSACHSVQGLSGNILKLKPANRFVLGCQTQGGTILLLGYFNKPAIFIITSHFSHGTDINSDKIAIQGSR